MWVVFGRGHVIRAIVRPFEAVFGSFIARRSRSQWRALRSEYYGSLFSDCKKQASGVDVQPRASSHPSRVTAGGLFGAAPGEGVAESVFAPNIEYLSFDACLAGQVLPQKVNTSTKAVGDSRTHLLCHHMQQ